jgi:hypothetical protein
VAKLIGLPQSQHQQNDHSRLLHQMEVQNEGEVENSIEKNDLFIFYYVFLADRLRNGQLICLSL